MLPVRVYYEDTDFTGVVYHANYVRYFERGRSDFLRLAGVSHAELLEQPDPLAFVVTGLSIDFRKAARIDDALVVRTTFDCVRGPRLYISQAISARRDADRRRRRSRWSASTSTAARAGRRRSLIERLTPWLAAARAIVSPRCLRHTTAPRARGATRSVHGFADGAHHARELLNPVALFLRADWVVKGVMVGLGLASLWSWAVIIDKLFRFAALNRAGRPLRGRRSAPAGRWRTWPPRPATRRASPAAHAAGGAARVARGARQGPARPLRRDPGRLPDAADRPGAGLPDRPRERSGSRRAWAAWPSSPPPRPSSACSARSGASCTPSRPIAIGEEHQPGGGRAGHRPGPVRHRHRPGRRHPGLHRLQQVLHRRRQVHRPAGGLRRRAGHRRCQRRLAERAA